MIKVNQIEKNYGKFHLNCTMEVPDGCVTGLIGENGAGKSTTFKMLLGLVRPDSGEIRIFGKNRKDLSENDRREIGTVLSDSFFSGYLTVAQLMSFMGDFYPGFQKKEFEKQCLRFQLPVDKKLKEFSTGMKAKLKILFAISVNARFLILDEPTNGLDPEGIKEIRDLILHLNQKKHITVLISSHILSELSKFATRYGIIHNGSLIEEFTEEELWKRCISENGQEFGLEEYFLKVIGGK